MTRSLTQPQISETPIPPATPAQKSIVTAPTVADMLEVERRHAMTRPGAKWAEIRERWSLTPTAYTQRLNAALDSIEALEVDPVTDHRLQRLRAAGSKQRSVRASTRTG